MPHVRVELSANIARNAKLQPFLADLARLLGECESVEPRGVKAYLNVREHFALNPEGPSGFAHLEVALMRGRPLDLRRAIAEKMRARVQEEFAENLLDGAIAITIEIREMDPETYLR